MNQLDPALKRLLKQASDEACGEREEAPFGFAARVVGLSRAPGPVTLFQQLQQTAWVLTCASLTLIFFWGLVAFLVQSTAPVPAPELPSALSFLASNLNR